MTKNGTDRNWTGKKILIAEDIQVNFILLEAILKTTNAELLWARDGKEAVEMCNDHEDIDLVLMDINMPVMNGMEATKEIRKLRKNLPVIAQTAYEMDFGYDELIGAGLTSVMSKPLLPDMTLEAISEYISTEKV